MIATRNDQATCKQRIKHVFITCMHASSRLAVTGADLGFPEGGGQTQ